MKSPADSPHADPAQSSAPGSAGGLAPVATDATPPADNPIASFASPSANTRSSLGCIPSRRDFRPGNYRCRGHHSSRTGHPGHRRTPNPRPPRRRHPLAPRTLVDAAPRGSARHNGWPIKTPSMTNPPASSPKPKACSPKNSPNSWPIPTAAKKPKNPPSRPPTNQRTRTLQTNHQRLPHRHRRHFRSPSPPSPPSSRHPSGRNRSHSDHSPRPRPAFRNTPPSNSPPPTSSSPSAPAPSPASSASPPAWPS